MKSASYVFAIGLLATSFAPPPALSATRSASFGVTVTVQAACGVSSPALAFGTYGAVAANTRSAVSVACTNPVPYDVSVSARPSTKATLHDQQINIPDPAMTGYVLRPVAAASVMRVASIRQNTGGETENGAAQAITLDGQTMGWRYVSPAAYADTIVITVTY